LKKSGPTGPFLKIESYLLPLFLCSERSKRNKDQFS
jgi:hypothetical protein